MPPSFRDGLRIRIKVPSIAPITPGNFHRSKKADIASNFSSSVLGHRISLCGPVYKYCLHGSYCWPWNTHGNGVLRYTKFRTHVPHGRCVCKERKSDEKTDIGGLIFVTRPSVYNVQTVFDPYDQFLKHNKRHLYFVYPIRFKDIIW